ncbi:MAG: PIG-L family deacetylase [Phycisphaerales bacterium]|jgi:LmbE family N-acetylglucosaminyl deacetylase|nr:PIG-L family deacetylase [Phycisphaerales bacterium]
MAWNVLNNIRQSLGAKIRRLHADSLCRWVADVCSKPYAMSPHPVLVIAPHQDDETLGCGGLIAMKRDLGVPVSVIFLTDGSNSHSDRPDLGAFTSDQLINTRQHEAVRALEILGLPRSDIHFLNAPDGKLDELTGLDKQTLVDRLAAIMSRHKTLEVYVPHRKDRHKDHEAVWDLVHDALAQADVEHELYQYLIWMPWRSPIFWKCAPSDLRGALCLEINGVLDRKIRAIDAYRSQHSVLPPGFLGRFHEPYEVFFRPRNGTSNGHGRVDVQRC